VAGVKAVFDTNVLIDHLRGVGPARDELRRFDERAVGVVTRAEVRVGTPPDREAATRAFLDAFAVVDLDREIAAGAVALRRDHRIKLPDAVVRPTLQAVGALLVTRNTKDFPADDPGVRVPYRLGIRPHTTRRSSAVSVERWERTTESTRARGKVIPPSRRRRRPDSSPVDLDARARSKRRPARSSPAT